jgi:group I intron endonuclease
MPFIYKITSPSGKVYVGSTGKDTVEARWFDYKKLSCKSQVKLYNSFKKHGVENHIFEKICECTIDDMLLLEAQYGNSLGVLGKNGLNLRLPKKGDVYIGVSEETRKKISLGKQNVSQETRRKMSLVHKGKVISEEQRRNHSLLMRGENHPMYGKKNSEETRRKISLNHADISGDKNPRARKVICTETGRIWTCAKYAANDLGVHYQTLKCWLLGINKNKSTLIYLENDK